MSDKKTKDNKATETADFSAYEPLKLFVETNCRRTTRGFSVSESHYTDLLGMVGVTRDMFNTVEQGVANINSAFTQVLGDLVRSQATELKSKGEDATKAFAEITAPSLTGRSSFKLSASRRRPNNLPSSNKSGEEIIDYGVLSYREDGSRAVDPKVLDHQEASLRSLLEG